ncbi:MAG TPA: carboxymuconolactone decarboxylase family protein [Longimicrobiales bacterium]|nr:carboxymuconolactone decarboxylase family protein [Longimicrobiales bacterium]
MRERLDTRIDYAMVAPDALRAMMQLERHVREGSIEKPLLHLIKLRASQVNGCAFCIDLHSREARADGESEQRLALLAVWREAPLFTDRERAALAWTEAVTRISEQGVSDELFSIARREFSEVELVELTLAVIAINGWNRLAIPFRTPIDVEAPAAAAS